MAPGAVGYGFRLSALLVTVALILFAWKEVTPLSLSLSLSRAALLRSLNNRPTDQPTD